MQTISTKFLGATNSNGSRIKATTTNGDSITVGWRYELGDNENHMEAAKLLLKKMKWQTKMTGGSTKEGMVFVFSNDVKIEV